MATQIRATPHVFTGDPSTGLVCIVKDDHQNQCGMPALHPIHDRKAHEPIGHTVRVDVRLYTDREVHQSHTHLVPGETVTSIELRHEDMLLMRIPFTLTEEFYVRLAPTEVED